MYVTDSRCKGEIRKYKKKRRKGGRARTLKREVAHKVNVDWVFAVFLICMQAS